MKKMLKGIEDFKEFEKLLDQGVKVQLVDHQFDTNGTPIIEYDTILKDEKNVPEPGIIYHVHCWGPGENPVYEGFKNIDDLQERNINGDFLYGTFDNGEEQGNYMIVGEDEFEGGYDPSKELDFDKLKEERRRKEEKNK